MDHMLEEVMAGAMAGASLAVREQEKVRAVFTRFLDLRAKEPGAPARAHAVMAIADVQALLEELARSDGDKPQPLPASVEGHPDFNTGHG